MDQEPFDYLFRILIITNSIISNKTKLLNTNTNVESKVFQETYKILCMFHLKIENISVKFQVWNLTGLDNFKFCFKSHFASSKAVFFTYQVSSRESFWKIDGFVEKVKKCIRKDTSVFLVGVCDEGEREVSFEEGWEKAQIFGYPFMEINCLEMDELKGVMGIVGRDILNRLKLNRECSFLTQTLHRKIIN